MANLILAFAIGVLCGIGYMYMRYSKRIQRYSHEIEEIRINNARIEGQMKILNKIYGVK